MSYQLISWSAVIKPNTWLLLTQFIEVFCLYMIKKKTLNVLFYVFSVNVYALLTPHRTETTHLKLEYWFFSLHLGFPIVEEKKTLGALFCGLYAVCIINFLLPPILLPRYQRRVVGERKLTLHFLRDFLLCFVCPILLPGQELQTAA